MPLCCIAIPKGMAGLPGHLVQVSIDFEGLDNLDGRLRWTIACASSDMPRWPS